MVYLTLFFVTAYLVSTEIKFVLTRSRIELTRADRIDVLVCEFAKIVLVGSIPGQVVQTQYNKKRMNDN